MSTTAISFRRGDKNSNDGFVGVEGEIVADLGTGGGAGVTTKDATIRLHTGDGVPGGVSMARADFANCSTVQLATGRVMGSKNLAYADLSNYENNTTNAAIVAQKLVKDYNLATNDDISDTTLGQKYAKTSLENVQSDIIKNKIGLNDYAKTDMSNVNTTQLATNTGHQGDNLAYANMSNVSTVNLATSAGHQGGNLAYADMSNLVTTNEGQIDDALCKGANGLYWKTVSGGGGDTSNCVHKTGTEIIEGKKTFFANGYNFPTYKSSDIVISATTSEQNITQQFQDKNAEELAKIQYIQNNEKHLLQFTVSNKNSGGVLINSAPLGIEINNSTLETRAFCNSTIQNDSNDNTLATTSWVDSNFLRDLDEENAGTNISITHNEDGEIIISSTAPSGTTNYTALSNKPQIGGTELSGNKTLAELGIQPAIGMNFAVVAQLPTNPDANTLYFIKE